MWSLSLSTKLHWVDSLLQRYLCSFSKSGGVLQSSFDWSRVSRLFCTSSRFKLSDSAYSYSRIPWIQWLIAILAQESHHIRWRVWTWWLSLLKFRVNTPLHELSDNVIKSLLSLPTERAQLTPTFMAHHNIDLMQFLGASSKVVSEDRTTFQLLVNTGCSVSCSGFKEDFHGQLAIGDFGQVNTADRKAKIKGFQMLCWDVVTTDGTRLTIPVQGYYSPTV